MPAAQLPATHTLPHESREAPSIKMDVWLLQDSNTAVCLSTGRVHNERCSVSVSLLVLRITDGRVREISKSVREFSVGWVHRLSSAGGVRESVFCAVLFTVGGETRVCFTNSVDRWVYRVFTLGGPIAFLRKEILATGNETWGAELRSYINCSARNFGHRFHTHTR